MKYYKGTRKRKKSSKSTFSSPESQNTSTNEERSEVSRDENKSQSSVRERKQRSSVSPQTEKHGTRTRAKKPKPNHVTPTVESNDNRKASSEEYPDSPDKNDTKTSKRSRGGIQVTRSSTRNSRSDGSSRKRAKASQVIKANSTSSVVDEIKEIPRNSHETLRKNFFTISSNAGSSRSNGPSRKRSSEAIGSSSATSKVKTKPPRNSYTVPKTARKTKTKLNEPSSPVSSETEESVFKDSDSQEEMQETVQREESGSNFETFRGDVSYDGGISCSEFLQQQVKILRSEFEIEDCPELAKHLQERKRQQKNHIPKEIIFKVLRRLNVKVEDELLRSLNRQAQRSMMKQVDEIRSNYSTLDKKTSNEENARQQPEGKLEELRKEVEMSVTELNGVKRLTDMAAEIESIAEVFSTNPLVGEVKQTNKIIQKFDQKVQKEGFSKAYQDTLTKGPLSHQEIVSKLFS